MPSFDTKLISTSFWGIPCMIMNEILPDQPWFKDCWCSLHKNKKGKGSYLVSKTKHRTEKRCFLSSPIFSDVPLPEKIKIDSITRIIYVAEFLLLKSSIWRFLSISVIKDTIFTITYPFSDSWQGLLKIKGHNNTVLYLFTKKRHKS